MRAGVNVRAVRNCGAAGGARRYRSGAAVCALRCGAFAVAVLCTHRAFHGVRVCFISVGDFSGGFQCETEWAKLFGVGRAFGVWLRPCLWHVGAAGGRATG